MGMTRFALRLAAVAVLLADAIDAQQPRGQRPPLRLETADSIVLQHEPGLGGFHYRVVLRRDGIALMRKLDPDITFPDRAIPFDTVSFNKLLLEARYARFAELPDTIARNKQFCPAHGTDQPIVTLAIHTPAITKAVVDYHGCVWAPAALRDLERSIPVATPALLVKRAAVRYPDMLRSANVEGQVIVDVSVSDAGRGSLHGAGKVRSDHELFWISAHLAVRASEYIAAGDAGHAVAGVVRDTFTYILLPDSTSACPTSTLSHARVCAVPEPFHQIMRSHGRAPQVLRDSAQTTDAIVAVARVLFREATDSVPVCITTVDSLSSREVSPHIIRSLGSRARFARNCPPTYASMVVTPRARPRPRGYIDPYRLEFRLPMLGNVLVARLWQGTGFTTYECAFGSAPEPVCRATSRGYS